MISTSHNFIFIHIPKTGGNSIHNALRAFSDDQVVCKSDIQDGVERFELTHSKYNISKHSNLRQYINEVPPSFLDDCRIFTCVRNPWERMLSYYFSPHRKVSKWCRSSFINMLNNETYNTEHYLRNIEGHVQNDISFMRFERLQSDFERTCASLNITEVNLPHYNKSNHENYQHYYDKELIQMVEQKSMFEIEMFDYKF